MAIEQDWWRNKLAEDIYATLKLKEQTLPTFHRHSPQIWVRRHLVDWMSVIVEQFGICATTQHLAVYILDYFMDGHEVEPAHVYLLAVVCLLLAVKFDEHCDKIPHISTLNKYLPKNQYCNVPSGYSASQYLSMELTVLKYLDWDLTVTTVPHFLPYFLKVAVDEDDTRDGIPITSKTVVEAYVEKHAKYFQEICLQDHAFRDYPPSLVASSCIAASRICMHLTPTWPKQMELMTDYFLEELLPCIQTMLRIHHQDEQNQQIHGSHQLLAPFPTPSATPTINYLPYTHSPVNYYGYQQSYPQKQSLPYTSVFAYTTTPVVYTVGPQIIPGCRGS